VIVLTRVFAQFDVA